MKKEKSAFSIVSVAGMEKKRKTILKFKYK